MAGDTIRLKALVNKEKNEVLFVESESDFVDILFSFLTMPIGEMVRLTRGISSSKLQIGCISNLYRSVENFDRKLFRGDMCQTMLLKPKNAAAFLCTTLKWRIGDGYCLSYYRCMGEKCKSEGGKLLSYYDGYCIHCFCHLTVLPVSAPPGGVFLKQWTRFLVSDELDVMTATSAASFSLVSKVQMKDVSLTEERTFQIGEKEVMKLLYYSLVSKKPLTETFLQQEMIPESRKRDAVQGICIKHEVQVRALEGKPANCIKLFVSKSKRTVCYAETSKEFIDLLFSFLTIPLGYVQKSSGCGASRGCVGQLYKSVRNIDDQNCFKSSDRKELLLNPKIPKYFGYKNQLLGIEEVNHQILLGYCRGHVIDATSSPSSTDHTNLTSLMDPKSFGDCEATSGGFLTGHAMFTVTDDMIITPISPVLSMSILNKLNVPCSDVEELDVFVGEKEASRLLLAVLTTKSALTEVFVSEGSKNESILKDPKKEL